MYVLFVSIKMALLVAQPIMQLVYVKRDNSSLIFEAGKFSFIIQHNINTAYTYN